jgi:hypothetical protein
MAMPNDETSNPAAATSEATATVRRNLAHLASGYERFVNGLTKATIQQVELNCNFMEGYVEDLNLLAQARTPEAFVQAELNVIRRNSERAVEAAQKISDGLHHTWIEMSGLATSFATVETPLRQSPSQSAS